MSGRDSGMLLFEGEVDDDMEEGMTATECRFTSLDAFGENTLGVTVVDTLSDNMTPLPAIIIAGEDKEVAEDEDTERARATGKERRLVFAVWEEARDAGVVVVIAGS